MDRKDFLNTLSTQIAEWQKDLNDLSGKAEQAGAKAKTEVQAQVKDLNAKLEDARSKLRQIQAVGPDAWEDVREGFEKSWTEVRSAFKTALSRFKS